jgi:hypothetical protein
MKFGFGLALALSVMTAAVSVRAQARTPVCDVVSEADAASVLGSVEKKLSTLGPDQCLFTVKGMSLMIGRVADQKPDAVAGLIDLPRQRARQGDVVKDEPGIGDRATSELSKGHVTLIAAAGDTVWTFGVDNVYSKDLSATLPKLRELAKKVVAGKRQDMPPPMRSGGLSLGGK